jgi:hypothetical protein
MKQAYYACLLITISMAVLLAGCGSGGTTPAAKDTPHESTACISCHQDPSWITPATGINVVTEWNRSTHNTQNGAGCADCHDDGYMHPASCSKCHSVGSLAKNPTNNPDRDGKCAKCHDSTKGYSTNRAYDSITKNTLTEHFSTPTLAAYTSGKYNARYVTKNYENSCRSCHNPHDTSSQMDKLRQWARSGKGDVTAPPWITYDFGRDPTRSTSTPGATPANSFGADCVRCHTATGYINFITPYDNPSKSIGPAYGGTSKTAGKEVLACNACHIDYSYTRRPVGQVTAYYNKSTASKMRIRIPVTYPDIGESNICLNCHVGREIGQIIKELANPAKTENKLITPSGAYNFANAGFENSHYLTAGASIFKTSGFEFYSSNYYIYPHGHDEIGVANFNNTGTSGPCITCHMKPGNHSFSPVTKDISGNITALTSTTCNNALCHNGNMTAAKLESQTGLFNAAMQALNILLQGDVLPGNPNKYKRKYCYQSTSPYFYYVLTDTLTTSQVKDWLTYDSSNNAILNTGPNNMGAAFNYNLLTREPGAFAHNDIYAKRLIYDSISWLFDNDIRATTNTNGYFSDVEAAIQTSVLTAQQKSDVCNYLFTTDTYTYTPKNLQNWRPGSSSLKPVY